MEPSRFDDFTKALATSSTRRAALRRIGGIFAGVSLAGLFPGLAFANNSACAHFCAAVFGADTPAAGQCTSDAAHGKGLCSTCGSNADPSSICCVRNSSGFCSSYSATLPCSCGANQTCQADGTCQACRTCQDLFCDATNPCCPGLQCCTYGNPSGEGFCCSVCIPSAFCPDPGC